MSLSADLQQFTAAFQSGYNTTSSGKYRNSIEKMIGQNAANQQKQQQAGQNSTYAAAAGALMQPGGKGWKPGMTLPAGFGTYLSQLPPAQQQAVQQGAVAAGFTNQQWAAAQQGGPTNPVSYDAVNSQASQSSGDDASNVQGAVYQGYMGGVSPLSQAKGGIVPQRLAAGGGVDPDQGAAMSSSNAPGLPSAPSGGGALPAPPPPAPPPPQAIPTQAAAAPAAAPPPPPQAVPAAPPQGGPPPQAAPAQAIPTQGTPPQQAQAPMKPPANLDKPLPVPPQAVQGGTPAEAAAKHAVLVMGLHPQSGIAGTPQAKANYVELQHGAGAASNEQVQQFRTALSGPNAGSEPLGIQNASLLNNLYNYDLENRGPQAAAADAFGVLQNYRINMQMYGGAAISSMQSGNLTAAAHYMEQAYSFFPDGNSVKVTPGANGALVATRTDPNGKTIDTNTFASPNDLTSFVQSSTNFEQYNTWLDNEQKLTMQAHKEAFDEQNAATNTGLRGQEVANEGANVQSQISTRGAQLGIDNQRLGLQKQAAARAGQPKPPSAGEVANYQNQLLTTLTGTGAQGSDSVGTSVNFSGMPAGVQSKFLSASTSVGMANNLDPATAASVTAYAIRNPGSVDMKAGTVSVQGQTYQLGKAAQTLLAPPQSKATGGVVNPGARVMAGLPT